MSKYPASEIPTQGQWIEFKVEETQKGKEAVNIKVVRDGSESREETLEEVSTQKVEAVHSEVSPNIKSNLGELNGVGPKYRELLEKANISSRQEIFQ